MKTIQFHGEIYRTDPDDQLAYTGTAANAYAGAPYKFFALTVGNVNSYKRNLGSTYEYKWRTTEPLNLVDMTDRAVRNSLFTNNANRRSLNVAFPVQNGRVKRFSDANTIGDDYRVISRICELHADVDGYIIRGRDIGFHDEVALCSRALRKLVFVEKTRNGNPVRARVNSFNLANFNQLNELAQEPAAVQEPAAPAPAAAPVPTRQFGMLSFGNNENNENNILAFAPKIKRQKTRRSKSRRRRQTRRH